MTQLLIIGGSDAGISAALRAKELDPTVKISIVVAKRILKFFQDAPSQANTAMTTKIVH
jgi:thioredoxin reductase